MLVIEDVKIVAKNSQSTFVLLSFCLMSQCLCDECRCQCQRRSRHLPAFDCWHLWRLAQGGLEIHHKVEEAVGEEPWQERGRGGASPSPETGRSHRPPLSQKLTATQINLSILWSTWRSIVSLLNKYSNPMCQGQPTEKMKHFPRNHLHFHLHTGDSCKAAPSLSFWLRILKKVSFSIQ